MTGCFHILNHFQTIRWVRVLLDKLPPSKKQNLYCSQLFATYVIALPAGTGWRAVHIEDVT